MGVKYGGDVKEIIVVREIEREWEMLCWEKKEK